MPVRGDQPGGHAPCEPADDRAGDIHGHGPARSTVDPLFLHVGHGHREDAGREDPLEEPPEDQGRKPGGRGVEQRGQRQQAGGKDDDPLPPQPIRHESHQGCRHRHAQGRTGEGQAHGGLAGVEELFQHRQERLGRVEPQEGAEPGEGHGQGAPVISHPDVWFR